MPRVAPAANAPGHDEAAKHDRPPADRSPWRARQAQEAAERQRRQAAARARPFAVDVAGPVVEAEGLQAEQGRAAAYLVVLRGGAALDAQLQQPAAAGQCEPVQGVGLELGVAGRLGERLGGPRTVGHHQGTRVADAAFDAELDVTPGRQLAAERQRGAREVVADAQPAPSLLVDVERRGAVVQRRGDVPGRGGRQRLPPLEREQARRR